VRVVVGSYRVNERVWSGVGALLATGLVLAPADAQYMSARSRAERGDVKDKIVPKPSPGPVIAVVSLARQRISVYGSAGLIGQSAVSTGMAGHPTPTGMFTVLAKNRWHNSNIYSGAPMPYMQRITWSGVAMHEGVVPGYPASHGCIRLPHQFAVELWGITRLNARVVVAPDDASVAEFASENLPVPLLTPAEEVVEGDKARTELTSLEVSGQKTDAIETASFTTRSLNPVQRAKAAKLATAADAQSKAKLAASAVEQSALKAGQANKAIAALRLAEIATNALRTKLEAATVDAAKSPEAAERAKASVAAVEAKLGEAVQAEEQARAQEAIATPEALAAARLAWEAENASRLATAAAKATEHGGEPISIFVSKKAGRVYIRQSWAPIHEAPVTFKDPELQIGTHNYVAVEPTANGQNLRWLAVSFPHRKAAVRDDDEDDRRRPSRKSSQAKAAEIPQRRETAAGALARIDMPEETRQFIADRLWVGASLIISDEGISEETGAYTDFIVLTR
jgi:L,D-transpeptidase catalytic domain